MKAATAAALFALLCATGQAAAKDYRVLNEKELPLHKPTGITFPARAGTLKREWVHERIDNPQSVRVGYGDNAWIEVAPSRESAAAKLTSLKRSLLVRYTATAVTQPADVGRGLFVGWKTAILVHRLERDAPPPARPGQRRRDFVAARRCGKYVVSVRSWSVDASNPEPLRQLGQAVREIFADPGAPPGRGFSCS